VNGKKRYKYYDESVDVYAIMMSAVDMALPDHQFEKKFYPTMKASGVAPDLDAFSPHF